MKDTGRILVIPDIHGCKKTLSALLKKINLRNEDTLYFLGDYIDRGPDSSGVLDIITNLQKHYENIIPLCGNHEYQILNAEKTFKKKEFYYYVKKINKSDDLLNKKKKIKKKYRKFMESLAYFAETKDYFFVHAGFDFKKDNPFEDVKSMLNIRTFKYDRHKAKGKTIITGHCPAEYKKIKKSIKKGKKIIRLDNGCVYTRPHKIYDYTQLGRLCCYNPDSRELICQKNIDIR